ncbi:hypothetical protein GVN19_25645, partial [Pseudomonas monteilii]|nr:hypothetical protein [Pseudomonas monteilii]
MSRTHIQVLGTFFAPLSIKNLYGFLRCERGYTGKAFSVFRLIADKQPCTIKNVGGGGRLRVPGCSDYQVPALVNVLKESFNDVPSFVV